MTPITVKSDLPPMPLPIKKDVEASHVAIYHARIKAMLNSQWPVLKGGFDREILKLLDAVWNAGYDKGLGDMDKMHGEAEEL